MSGELREAIDGARNRIDPANRRLTDATDRTNIRQQLSGADYVSLTALFVGWASTLLLLRGEPNWALVAMFGAFGLDKLDGWYARRTGMASPFGRQVDSFIDVFVYLVPAALLFHVAVAPHPLASLVVGFLVIALGGLRLIRHNSEGFGTDDNVNFYHGTTVVHTNLLVVATYFLPVFLAEWSGWLSVAIVAAGCPLMVSNYKSYKTTVGHALAGFGALVATALALFLEYGLL